MASFHTGLKLTAVKHQNFRPALFKIKPVQSVHAFFFFFIFLEVKISVRLFTHVGISQADFLSKY